MIAKIQKWGNSQGIRVSKTILEQSNISLGDRIEISAKNGQITLKSVSKIKGKYKLKELVGKLPNDYKPQEVDWGRPVGKEEW